MAARVAASEASLLLIVGSVPSTPAPLSMEEVYGLWTGWQGKLEIYLVGVRVFGSGGLGGSRGGVPHSGQAAVAAIPVRE
jgi:hypothetical protein